MILMPQPDNMILFLQTLSSNLTRNLWTQSLNPALTYRFKEGMQLVIGRQIRAYYR